MAVVVITKLNLEKNRACSAYLRSPEWDQKQQALVYSDWSATVQRLLSTPQGITYLSFLVSHKLVPMTMEEFTGAAGPLVRTRKPAPAPAPVSTSVVAAVMAPGQAFQEARARTRRP